MAMHDQERRPARDYMRDARTRYTQTSTASKWVAMVVGLALILFIASMIYSAMNPSPTVEAIRETPATPQTTTIPSEAPSTQPAPSAPTTQPQ
jgi:heme/copper-type cytochrome/quinol oxidase subunit 1